MNTKDLSPRRLVRTLFATAVLPAAVLSIAGIGCGVPQSDPCAKFVQCQAHYDETYALSPTDTSDYSEDGVCWTNQTRADGCTDSCNVANEVLRRALVDSGDDPGPCDAS